MSAIMLDTNAYTAFKNGISSARDAVAAATMVGVPPVVVAELLSGFARGSRAERNKRELTRFLGHPRVSVPGVGYNTSVRYAQVFAELRAAGTPIPVNDMWIAACAIQYDVPLLTYDTHFVRVGSLELVPV